MLAGNHDHGHYSGAPLAAAEGAADAGDVRHHEVDRVCAEAAGQRRDDLANLLVVGADVLRRGVRDDLRGAHRVALRQERHDRDLRLRAIGAGGEPDDAAAVR
jgi:hypothetical protein